LLAALPQYSPQSHLFSYRVPEPAVASRSSDNAVRPFKEVAVRVIRSFTVLLPSVLVIQACAPAAEPRPTLEELEAEVRARSEAVIAAEMAGDYETAVTFFAPDAIIQMPNAPQIQGRDTLLELYEATLGTTLEFEGTTTDIVPAASGDLAYEYGINRMVFETPDGPVEDMGKYLVIWRKIDGEWFVAAIAVSSDAPPPA
jgi:ketosteroid isomerase-like protein